MIQADDLSEYDYRYAVGKNPNKITDLGKAFTDKVYVIIEEEQYLRINGIDNKAMFTIKRV